MAVIHLFSTFVNVVASTSFAISSVANIAVAGEWSSGILAVRIDIAVMCPIIAFINIFNKSEREKQISVVVNCWLHR